jgi:hypothetical protein
MRNFKIVLMMATALSVAATEAGAEGTSSTFFNCTPWYEDPGIEPQHRASTLELEVLLEKIDSTIWQMTAFNPTT